MAKKWQPLAQLPEVELSKVDELKELIADDPHYKDEEKAFCSDYTFVRYLRARDWNVKKAAEMLSATLKWRHGMECACVIIDVVAEFKPYELTAADMCDQGRRATAYTHGRDLHGRCA